MTAAQFERLFEPSVRTAFNFARLRRERWPITLTVVEGRDQLGALLLPWRHAKRSQLEQRTFTEDGRQHTVASATKTLHAMSETRRGAVAAEVLAATEAVPRVQLLPAARVPEGILLLDGVHRCVARYFTGGDFEVVLAVVSVPMQVAWSVVDVSS